VSAGRAGATAPWPGWLSVGAGALTFDVVARPGASRSEILRSEPRGVVIALTATPHRGKANEELAGVIADSLHVMRSSVEVVRGHTSRRKLVRVATASPASIARELIRLLESRG